MYSSASLSIASSSTFICLSFKFFTFIEMPVNWLHLILTCSKLRNSFSYPISTAAFTRTTIFVYCYNISSSSFACASLIAIGMRSTVSFTSSTLVSCFLIKPLYFVFVFSNVSVIFLFK